MLIETNNYLTIKNFSKKVNSYPAKIWYYINQGNLTPTYIDGMALLHKDLIVKWPPQLKKTGRKPKTKG